jgi:hypothetical protein
VVPPRAGVTWFAPFPRMIRDRKAEHPDQSPIPIPDAAYTLEFMRTLMILELPVGSEAMPNEQLTVPYKILRFPFVTFKIRASHERLDPAWISTWAR